MHRKQNVWPHRVMCASMIRSKQIGHKKSMFLFSTVEPMPFKAIDRLLVWWRLVCELCASSSMELLAPATLWTVDDVLAGARLALLSGWLWFGWNRAADDDEDAFNPLRVLLLVVLAAPPMCGDDWRLDIFFSIRLIRFVCALFLSLFVCSYNLSVIVI